MPGERLHAIENYRRPETHRTVVDALVNTLKPVPSLCGVALLLIGSGVLLGWLLHVPELTSVRPDLAAMKPNTALGFVLVGAALLLAGRFDRRSRQVRLALSALTTLLAVLTLAEYGLQWDAGIDQLLFTDPAPHESAPGRMSPITAIMFALLGLASLLLAVRPERVDTQPSDWLALCAGAISILVLLGYLYGVQSLYAVKPFASVALHTACGFLVCAVGVLSAHPQSGLMRRLASDGPSGVLMRRLLPMALVVPVVMGFVRLKGEQAGWYGTEFGLALFASSNVFCFSALVWWTAGALLKSDAVRRHAETQLSSSEESLSITLQSIGDAVIATDARGDIVRMNPVAEQLTGFTLAAARGQPLHEVFRIINPDTRSTVPSPVERVLREGVTVGLANHTLLVASNGTERPIADSGAPIRDAHGSVRGVVLVFRDVAEEEQERVERKRNDQLLRAAFAAGRMIAWETDLEKRTLLVSDNARTVLGVLPQGRLESLDDALALTHPDDRHLLERALRNPLWNAREHGRRFRIVRPDTQEVLWLEWRSVTRDAPGYGSSIRGVVLDVTETVRSESALRTSEARYRTQFEAAPEAIVTLDVDQGAFVEANENAERLFGYSRQELSRLDPVALSPPTQPDGRSSAEAARENIARALAGQRLVFEWVHRNAAGTDIPCEIRLVQLPGAGRLCRGSVLDISERKRAEAAHAQLEETLRQTEDQLRQAQKMEAVGQLAGGVAHDFNNLLSVILGYVSMLIDSLRAEDPMRGALEQIARASERAAKLTGQLLAFSRQQVLSAQVVDLNQIIGELADMLQRLIGEDIELALMLHAESSVLVDRSQIEQVVMNLVVNARDAMSSGGRLTIDSADVTLDEAYARSHLGVEPGHYVALSVSDTGSGMDKATQERMFEPFFTTKGQGKGTGLGLSTVFGIVKQSGGHIWAYSEPGQGTTFKIYLPCAAGHPEMSRAFMVPATKTLRGSETVLLVEDEDQVRALARTVLHKYGYTVLEAANGGEALLISEQTATTIDALVTDVVMPRMNGRELADRLTQARPTMKVLFMSGYTGDAILRRGIISAGTAFIQKPLLPEALAAKLRQVLDAETG